MNFIRNISKSIERFVNKKYIVSLIVIFIIILLAMEKGPTGSEALKKLNNGSGMLDMNFSYSSTQVYSMLSTIGNKGREIYSGLLGLDYVFSIVFMFLQSLIITFLLEKAHVSETFKILNMLPFVRSLMDVIENCFILAFISNYPVRLPVLVRISSVFTNLKWVTYGLIIAVFILLLIIIMFKAAVLKIRNWGKEV